MEWQPIETAPKDGTFVDLWVQSDGDGHRITDCLWLKPDQAWWMIGRAGFVQYWPTHWMPLPPPPYATKADSDGDDGA